MMGGPRRHVASGARLGNPPGGAATARRGRGPLKSGPDGPRPLATHPRAGRGAGPVDQRTACR